MMDANAVEFSDFGLVEMRHVQERRLVQPLALHEHLEDVDQIHRSLQVTLMRCDINHTLEYTN